MKKLISTLVSCVAVAFLMAPVAFAQTPDGKTPANEGVCDGLLGGTAGLYGLCVAYCEAIDAGIDDLGTSQAEAASPKVLRNYRGKMRAGDPDMPCVKAPCPCWDANELTAVTDFMRSRSPFCVDVSSAKCLVQGAGGTCNLATSVAFNSGGLCQIFNPDFNLIRVQLISVDDALSCESDLFAAADELAVNCPPRE